MSEDRPVLDQVDVVASDVPTPRYGRPVDTWGKEPWDNDTAAAWFGGLWESGNVPAAVRQGLDSESSDEAVAALWVCAELCRAYVWPIDAFDDTLRAAVATAERILNGEDPDGYLELWNNDPEVVDRLRHFREALVARLPSAG